MICKICTNPHNNKTFQIREMMFGSREEFLYFECSKCGCLQIAEIPENIEKYYPPNYLRSSRQRSPESFIQRFLRIRSASVVLPK
jgi:hypothetical protein